MIIGTNEVRYYGVTCKWWQVSLVTRGVPNSSKYEAALRGSSGSNKIYGNRPSLKLLVEPGAMELLLPYFYKLSSQTLSTVLSYLSFTYSKQKKLVITNLTVINLNSKVGPSRNYFKYTVKFLLVAIFNLLYFWNAF